MDNNRDGLDPLEAVAAARTLLAERLFTPWWYHPVLGLLIGLVALQLSGTFGRSGLFLIPLPLLGMLALGRLYRRLSGIDLYGSGAPDGGPQGRALLGVYACLLVACLATAFLLGIQVGISWPAWVLAALIVIGTVFVGRAYDRLLRAQLRGAAA